MVRAAAEQLQEEGDSACPSGVVLRVGRRLFRERVYVCVMSNESINNGSRCAPDARPVARAGDCNLIIVLRGVGVLLKPSHCLTERKKSTNDRTGTCHQYE